jgi:hypothetical protein
MKYRRISVNAVPLLGSFGVDSSCVTRSLGDFQSRLASLTYLETAEVYFHHLSDLLLTLHFDALPQGVRDAWQALPVGFHTHEIAKLPLKAFGVEKLSLVVKAYMIALDQSPGKQGAIMVVPHGHVGIPDAVTDRFHQAVTLVFKTEGDLQIKEEHFDLVGLDSKSLAHYRKTIGRALGSIAYDENGHDIHNFVAEGTGKGMVIAVYITGGDPNLYYQEIVTTSVRAAQLNALIDKGFTPYRPTCAFSDSFIVSPSLTLTDTQDRALHSISFTALQAQVRDRHFAVSKHTWGDFENNLARLNLTDDAASQSAHVSIAPLLSAVREDRVSQFYVSWKPETSSCEDSAHFRIHYDTLEAGIALHHELRLNVREHVSKNKTKTIHIYISRATHEAHGKQMLASKQFDIAAIGIVHLAVNPFNIIDGLRRNAANLAGYGIHFHIHPDCETDDFVSNNLGSRHLSISANGKEYFHTVRHAISELIGHVDIKISAEAAEFWTPAERKAAAVDKKKST